MSIAATNLWVFNFQLAAQSKNWRSARCILDNQLAGNPKLDWRRYVTTKQAVAIEKTIIDAPIAPEPLQTARDYKKRGDDHIITISSGDHTVVMTSGELRKAGQAIRQETRKRKRGA